MYLSRLIIRNFRNFEEVDIPLDGNLVVLGENGAGKSNLLFAIRLVLDPTLPDSARQLKLSDFHDCCELIWDPQIEVHVDFADFESDLMLLALLTDFRTREDPAVARLSYAYRKKFDVNGGIQTEDDCEFFVYGGGEESRIVPHRVRRRIALDMLNALRDAEKQLASWQYSPLRPLLEHALTSVSNAELGKVATALDTASIQMESLPPIRDLESNLRDGILALAGSAHDVGARLRFAAADPTKLARSIALFIDDGNRSIAEASLGSANVLLIALKLAEFALRRSKNERSYSLLCIEEPEAHLHPQLQRTVFDSLFRNTEAAQALVVTSHSPTLAAVAPLRSIVCLRWDGRRSSAHSLAALPVTPEELDDIERYLTATRAELLFAKGVIFVEGDAEENLLPTFGKAIGHNLDRLGITVCNVGGTNFTPYVKLAASLGLPYAVITDWDPIDGKRTPLGMTRALEIMDAHSDVTTKVKLTAAQRREFEQAEVAQFGKEAALQGIFLNSMTFEVAIARTPNLLDILLDILEGQEFGTIRRSRLHNWRSGVEPDPKQLLAMIADIGKGRLSSKLAKKLKGLAPPDYIADAIRFLARNV